VKPVRVGVIGLGYWGPNLARNFDRLGDCELRWICDSSGDALERLKPQFPSVRTTTELDDLLSDDELDAIAIATPVPLHAELAVRVLDAGKHCFVEKPLAQSVGDAERVVEAGDRSGKVLMVGHLLEYHPGVRKLKDVADSGRSATSTATGSTSASCGLTRTRSGRSVRMTSRCCSTSRTRSPFRCTRSGRATCGRRSRTSSSVTCASRRG
jgi:predicted dehydrogenase